MRSRPATTKRTYHRIRHQNLQTLRSAPRRLWQLPTLKLLALRPARPDPPASCRQSLTTRGHCHSRQSSLPRYHQRRLSLRNLINSLHNHQLPLNAQPAHQVARRSVLELLQTPRAELARQAIPALEPPSSPSQEPESHPDPRRRLPRKPPRQEGSLPQSSNKRCLQQVGGLCVRGINDVNDFERHTHFAID